MPADARPVVMVVDDDAQMCALARRILNQAGYEVEVFEGGPAALDRLGGPAEVFALVTDKDMPGMDGFDVARRAHQLRPALPVVMFTAHSKRIPAEVVQDLDAYLPKPFRALSDLTDAVKRAVEARQNKLERAKLQQQLGQLLPPKR